MPLNDGYNWKGDPNATYTGQAVPQLPLSRRSPVAGVLYDTATGTYIGPDGRRYTQTNLAQSAKRDNTWQSMLMPPDS